MTILAVSMDILNNLLEYGLDYLKAQPTDVIIKAGGAMLTILFVLKRMFRLVKWAVFVGIIYYIAKMYFL